MKQINYDKCSSVKIEAPKEKTTYYKKYCCQRKKITRKEYRKFTTDIGWDDIFLSLFTKYIKEIK